MWTSEHMETVPKANHQYRLPFNESRVIIPESISGMGHSSRGESSVIRRVGTYANDIRLEFVDIVELNKEECKTQVKNSITSKGNATLTNMPVNGQHHNDQKISFIWMKDSPLKRHTEAMVHAIQDQTVKI